MATEKRLYVFIEHIVDREEYQLVISARDPMSAEYDELESNAFWIHQYYTDKLHCETDRNILCNVLLAGGATVIPC